MSSPDISPNTMDLYAGIVKRIEKQFGNEYTADEVIPWIQSKYTNNHTIKNYLTAVMYFSKGSEYDKYYKLFQTVKNELRKTEKSQMLTEKQSEQFVSWSELQTMYKDAEYMFNQDKMPLDKLVLLAVYTLTDPVRADYGNMTYITTPKQLREIENDKNYCYLGPGAKFIFQEYKTAKSYGRRDIKIPAKLSKLLKLHKLGGATAVFHGTENALVIALRRLTKELTGKAVGVNLFRHARITDLYESNPSIQEKEELAYNMLHSAFEGERYRVLDE